MLHLLYCFRLLFPVVFFFALREKGRDLIQSYDESPYTNRKFKKSMSQHKNATKTSISQRLRRPKTVSRNTDRHPTGVVILRYKSYPYMVIFAWLKTKSNHANTGMILEPMHLINTSSYCLMIIQVNVFF